jgi:P-type E1-E2 ATPase
VKTLQKMGEVVAITGSGIEDAPALRCSDVGFALETISADITKETADVILLNDDFASIVLGI